MQFKNMGKILSKYMNNFANATSLAKLRLTQMTILMTLNVNKNVMLEALYTLD